MVLKKRWGLLSLVLVLGLLFSGCELFNDVDLDDVLPEELSRADFLNTLVNDFEPIVQSFIDATYYEEPEVPALEEPFEHLEFPEAEDLDFTDFFSHYDLLEGPGAG